MDMGISFERFETPFSKPAFSFPLGGGTQTNLPEPNSSNSSLSGTFLPFICLDGVNQMAA
jgi:hypothetical protein